MTCSLELLILRFFVLRDQFRKRSIGRIVFTISKRVANEISNLDTLIEDVYLRLQMRGYRDEKAALAKILEDKGFCQLSGVIAF